MEDNPDGTAASQSSTDIKYTEGNVAIGRATAEDVLHLSNPGAGNEVGIRIDDPTNAAYGARLYFNDTENTFNINTINAGVSSNLGLAMARNTGRVGIGTSTPEQPLDVRGNVAADQINLRRESDGVTNAFIKIENDGATASQNDMVFQNNSGNRGFVFTTNDGTNGVNDPKMRLSGAGNLGIGELNPSAKLAVNAGALGETAGDELDIARFRTATGNNTQLRIKRKKVC